MKFSVLVSLDNFSEIGQTFSVVQSCRGTPGALFPFCKIKFAICIIKFADYKIYELQKDIRKFFKGDPDRKIRQELFGSYTPSNTNSQ